METIYLESRGRQNILSENHHDATIFSRDACSWIKLLWPKKDIASSKWLSCQHRYSFQMIKPQINTSDPNQASIDRVSPKSQHRHDSQHDGRHCRSKSPRRRAHRTIVLVICRRLVLHIIRRRLRGAHRRLWCGATPWCRCSRRSRHGSRGRRRRWGRRRSGGGA
jgi:hypothetical protein